MAVNGDERDCSFSGNKVLQHHNKERKARGEGLVFGEAYFPRSQNAYLLESSTVNFPLACQQIFQMGKNVAKKLFQLI